MALKKIEEWGDREWKEFEREALSEVIHDKDGCEVVAKHSLAIIRITTARLRRCVQVKPKDDSTGLVE